MMKKTIFGLSLTVFGLGAALAQQPAIKRTLLQKTDFPDGYTIVQAIAEVAAGGVISVLQAGYELMGRLVRPAMVAVAAKGSTGPAAPEQPAAASNPYAGAGADGEGSGGAFDTKA